MAFRSKLVLAGVRAGLDCGAAALWRSSSLIYPGLFLDFSLFPYGLSMVLKSLADSENV